MLFTLTTIIHLIVSVVMVAVVLLQVGKGATMGASFGGGGSSSQTVFGSGGPATFLVKVTAGCAVIFMLTSLYLTYMSGSRKMSSVMTTSPTVQKPVKSGEALPTPATPTQQADKPLPIQNQQTEAAQGTPQTTAPAPTALPQTKKP